MKESYIIARQHEAEDSDGLVFHKHASTGDSLSDLIPFKMLSAAKQPKQHGYNSVDLTEVELKPGVVVAESHFQRRQRMVVTSPVGSFTADRNHGIVSILSPSIPNIT